MTTELLLQYGIYAAIIVVGIIALIFLKRATRLPDHADLKARLCALHEDIAELIKASDDGEGSAYDFFYMTSKCANRANKLAYTVTLMAQKERDGNLDAIAALLEEAHVCIIPYKFKTKGKEETSGLVQAKAKTEKAISSLELILERDRDLKAKRIH